MTPAALDASHATAASLLLQLAAWDLHLAQALRGWMTDWPPAAVLAVAAISHLGDRWVIGLTAALACLWVAQRGQPWQAAAAGALLAGQGLLVWTLKDWAARARPPGGAIEPAWVVIHGHSLPSGHATAAVVGFGLLAWLALHSGPPHWRRHRCAIVAASAVLALAVGASRVLLGAHFATDVLAGWALGSAWLAIAVALLRRLPPGGAARGVV